MFLCKIVLKNRLSSKTPQSSGAIRIGNIAEVASCLIGHEIQTCHDAYIINWFRITYLVNKILSKVNGDKEAL